MTYWSFWTMPTARSTTRSWSKVQMTADKRKVKFIALSNFRELALRQASHEVVRGPAEDERASLGI